MKVELVGFSQGVSLANREETLNYLEFAVDGGEPFRIPVSVDALDALMAKVYGPMPSEGGTQTRLDVPEPVPDGASVFGEEDEDPQPLFAEDRVPLTEDEVPSV